MPKVRIGVLGLGFMGQTHVRAIQAIAARGAPCHLAAVCDASPERLKGRTTATGNYDEEEGERLFDPDSLHTFTDADELFAETDIDVVHVCTWTDSHVDFAIRALQAGKHVLVEKPVAVGSAAVEELARAVADTDRICMPAMCMRFWPGWTWLRERIADGAYGPVHSAVFRRLGTAPGWGDGFYTDTSRSGGALVDLHIHDADFVRWCFGEPASVQSTGGVNHLTTLYRFPGGPEHVVAEGGWSLAPSAGFRMTYLVCFQRATADFDIGRTPQLLLHDDDGSHSVELPAATGYEAEIEAMVQAVATGQRDGLPTIDEALAVTRLLERERAATQC